MKFTRLTLPHDTVRHRNYKYALVVVDVASLYKDAEALRTKDRGEVATGFERTCSRMLSWPKLIQGVNSWVTTTTTTAKHGTAFCHGEAGNHRAQSFVEQANRTLAERLFGYQYAQEVAAAAEGGKELSREWVKRLPAGRYER